MNAIRPLSVRLAMLGGALVLATAGIVSSVAIVGAAPAVAAGTITQIAPDTGSASHGTPFSDQLQTSGNIGPVTFATDSTTTWGTVSSTGAVSFPGTTSPGTYLLFGTDADAFGDAGQWQYVLTCCRPPITQTAPTSGTVTTSGSATFTDHLRTTGNTGPVTFTKTGGTAGLKVLPRGKITTTGNLSVGHYTADGTVHDAFGDTGTFTYTLTVKAVTIIQTAPTKGSVTTTGSAAFTDRLNTTGNIGKRRFVKTGGGTGLKISFGGKITTTGTLAKGTYKATGTVADHFGDTGTFTYTLTVKVVTITQTAPTKGSASYGTPLSDQLQTSGNIGPVTFVTDSATTWGTVSSTGVVSAPGTALPGTYLLFGTDTDSSGDTGQWQYTLTVTHLAPITQTGPASGLVTMIGSPAFTDQLNTTGNIGAVIFTKTGGGAGLEVSSSGQITTTGTLAAGTYTATGTMSDAFGDTGAWDYTLTVAPSFPFTEPTSGSVSVAGSAAFTVQLRTTGNVGPVTFAKTGGGTGIKVSSRGKITTTGTLAMGTYTASGTMYDASGDTGTWDYTLTVKAAAITPTAPTVANAEAD
jgi:large repetitive protein